MAAAAAAAAGNGGTDSGSDTDSIAGLRLKRDASIPPQPSWFIVCQLYDNSLINIRFDVGWLFHLPVHGLPIPGFIVKIRLFLSVDPPDQQQWDVVTARPQLWDDDDAIPARDDVADAIHSILLFGDMSETPASDGVREHVAVLRHDEVRRAMRIMSPFTSWAREPAEPCPSPHTTPHKLMDHAKAVCILLESEHEFPAPIAELTASYISAILPFAKQAERLRTIEKSNRKLSLEIAVANSRSLAETRVLMNVETEREALRLYADVVKEWLGVLQTAVDEQCLAKPAVAAASASVSASASASASSLDTGSAAKPVSRKRKLSDSSTCD